MLTIVNRKNSESSRYLFSLVPFGRNFFLVHANHLDTAMRILGDYLDDNSSSVLSDESIMETFLELTERRLHEFGGPDDQEWEQLMWEAAERGHTSFGDHWIPSDDWRMTENPTREQVKECAADGVEF